MGIEHTDDAPRKSPRHFQSQDSGRSQVVADGSRACLPLFQVVWEWSSIGAADYSLQATAPHHMFLVEPICWAWFFHFLMVLKEKSLWRMKSIWNSYFSVINKVLLEHSHLFVCLVYGHFYIKIVELGSCDRDHVTQNI